VVDQRKSTFESAKYEIELVKRGAVGLNPAGEAERFRTFVALLVVICPDFPSIRGLNECYGNVHGLHRGTGLLTITEISGLLARQHQYCAIGTSSFLAVLEIVEPKRLPPNELESLLPGQTFSRRNASD